jgi:hypothetical protein
MKNLRTALVCLLLPLTGALDTTGADPGIREITLAPPISVTPIVRTNWDRSTPEAAYLGAYSANKAADKAWIIETFAPAERDTVARNVNDQQLLAGNTAIFAGIATETIQKRVEYGSYVILVVEARGKDGRRFLRNIPFKPVDGQWFVTNDLASDEMFLRLKSGYVD